MKKTIILILALLPIVLLVVISIAGRILSTYQHIEVARVVFVDDAGNEREDSKPFVLSPGETKPAKIKIYPELASDKRVSYTSSDENVCTVDGEGNITGKRSGSAIIIVRTVDGNKTAMLTVIVRAGSVTGVTLTPEALSMKIGESRDLTVNVEPYAALNKNVTYTISDPSLVTVRIGYNENRDMVLKLTAKGTGTTIVTVTTVDGSFTATCTVTVTEDTPPVLFDFTNVPGITLPTEGSVGYFINQPTFDLTAGLVIDETVEPSDVHFRIVQGDGATVDENGVLTFDYDGYARIEVFVGDVENPTYRTEVLIVWQS